MRLRIALLAVTFCLKATAAWAWSDTAMKAEVPSELRYSGTARVFAGLGNFSPVFEATLREAPASQNVRKEGKNTIWPENHPQRYISLQAGSYYRLNDNFQIGGFYRAQSGARHNNDWVGWEKTAGLWDWFWLDTRDRWEHSAIADITGRWEWKFLPGENWVFELKNRLQHTYYNEERYNNVKNWGPRSPEINETVYMARPGLYYFWLSNDAPFLTFFFQSEIFFPLNFGDTTINEIWLYGGMLYHINSSLSVAFTVAQAKWIWSTSDSVRNTPASEMCGTQVCRDIRYTSAENATIIGLTAVFKFEISHANEENE